MGVVVSLATPRSLLSVQPHFQSRVVALTWRPAARIVALIVPGYF